MFFYSGVDWDDVKNAKGLEKDGFFLLYVVHQSIFIGIPILFGLFCLFFLCCNIKADMANGNAGTLSMFFIASYLYWAWGADRRRREKLAAKRDADNSN